MVAHVDFFFSLFVAMVILQLVWDQESSVKAGNSCEEFCFKTHSTMEVGGLIAPSLICIYVQYLLNQSFSKLFKCCFTTLH